MTDMTGQEKYDRVLSMLQDNGETWDLSSKDKDAIRHVLGMVNLIADELAGYEGSTVPDVMNRAHRVVCKIQEGV